MNRTKALVVAVSLAVAGTLALGSASVLPVVSALKIIQPSPPQFLGWGENGGPSWKVTASVASTCVPTPASSCETITLTAFYWEIDPRTGREFFAQQDATFETVPGDPTTQTGTHDFYFSIYTARYRFWATQRGCVLNQCGMATAQLPGTGYYPLPWRPTDVGI